MKQLLSGSDWQVSHFLPGETGAATGLIPRIASGELYGAEFIPASVPGDVQSDALDAGIIEDINYGFNARLAEWTYQRDWVYVKRFTPCEYDCKRIRLSFDGVDYACEVYLDGKWLGDHEVAWKPFSFDITDRVESGRESSLIVLVKHAPHNECQWGYTSKVNNLKARFAYGWDWAARVVPLGIWKDVYLTYEDSAVIDDVYVTADTDYNGKTAIINADIKMRYNTDLKTTPLTVKLTHPSGRVEEISLTAEGEDATVSFDIKDAELWWPNGMGEHPLYTVEVSLGDGTDSRTVRTGLRHIEWKRTKGAPKDALPYQPYINGRRVFLQGYNFTPIRQLYGRPMPEVYRRRVDLVKRTGANYLRIWGGGLLEREELYDLCDENGILLMQELFQSSATGNNHPPRSKEYIDMMTDVTESAVMQKRNHPSLISWCGGNELCFRGEYMDADGNILIEGVEGNEGKTYSVSDKYWVPVSPSYPTLKAIEKAVKKQDKYRQWFHTSGSGPVIQNTDIKFVGGGLHDTHGPWEVLPPELMYKYYNSYDMMMHHEFGCPASARVKSIEAMSPEEYRWPIDKTNPLANYRGRMHLAVRDGLRPYFGEIENYVDFALASHFMQWEQTRYELESHRRAGEKRAGASLWHFGEPWPNFVDNCVVDAFDQPKPAYYGHKKAFTPLHLSAHYDTVIHKDGFSATLTLLNSTDKSFSGSILAEIYSLDGKRLYYTDGECFAEADSVVESAMTVNLKTLPEGVFFLRQTLKNVEGEAIETGYSIHSTKDEPYRELMLMDEVELQAELLGSTVSLTNKGDRVISALTVSTDNSDRAFFSDGCIMLLPGETAAIDMSYDGETPTLYVSGFGVPFYKIDA